jgi:hypothetical protein
MLHVPIGAGSEADLRIARLQTSATAAPRHTNEAVHRCAWGGIGRGTECAYTVRRRLAASHLAGRIAAA